MKISTARLKQIINEELFYREFHRKTDELTEDKVSDKISKLKDEGTPQKQAVAIALDMEERGDLKEGFAVSKQDLVNVGLPLDSVRAGLYDRVIVRLEREGAAVGLPALKMAVRSLPSYKLNDSSAVLKALEKEL